MIYPMNIQLIFALTLFYLIIVHCNEGDRSTSKDQITTSARNKDREASIVISLRSCADFISEAKGVVSNKNLQRKYIQSECELLSRGEYEHLVQTCFALYANYVPKIAFIIGNGLKDDDDMCTKPFSETVFHLININMYQGQLPRVTFKNKIIGLQNPEEVLPDFWSLWIWRTVENQDRKYKNINLKLTPFKYCNISLHTFMDRIENMARGYPSVDEVKFCEHMKNTSSDEETICRPILRRGAKIILPKIKDAVGNIEDRCREMNFPDTAGPSVHETGNLRRSIHILALSLLINQFIRESFSNCSSL